MNSFSVTILSLTLLSVMNGACAQKNQPLSQEEPYVDIETLVESVLGGKPTLTPNSDKAYILCTYTEDPLVHYMVVDSSGSVVLKKEYTRGTVKWYSRSSISVTYMPGVVKEDISVEDERIINLEEKYER